MSGIGAIAIGVLFLLIGYGKAGVSSSAEANEAFLKKWRRFFRIAGPILILGGIAIMVFHI
jgi:hypothetical protein